MNDENREQGKGYRETKRSKTEICILWPDYAVSVRIEEGDVLLEDGLVRVLRCIGAGPVGRLERWSEICAGSSWVCQCEEIVA